MALARAVASLLPVAGAWAPDGPLTFRVEDVFYERVMDCRTPGRVLAQEEDRAGLETVHVAYSSDAGNFAGLLGSMLSLGSHAADPSAYTIHLLVTREDLARAEALIACFRRELVEMLPVVPAVQLHELRPLPVDPSSLSPSAPRPELWKPQTFARLYLHDYLPTARRVIWLDHDTIVRYDLAELYRMRMKRPLAAVPEWGNGTYWSYRQMVPPRLRARLPSASQRVFNSGVLLLDLQRWRSEAVSAAVEALLPDFAGINGEQLILNLVFQDYDALEWRWNFMGMFLPLEMPRLCLDGARVLHWTWSNKPWTSGRRKAAQLHDALFRRYAPRHRCDALPEPWPWLPPGPPSDRRARAAGLTVPAGAAVLRNYA